MPLRRRVVSALIRPSPAMARAGFDTPTRTLWVDTLPLDGRLLLDHPIFRSAPLTGLFRERISRQDDIVIKDVRRGRHDVPEALILQAGPRFNRAWHGLGITDRADAALTKVACVSVGLNTWIGMSSDRVWVSLDAEGDAGVLGLFVNLISHLDERGRPPRRIPPGRFPDEDAEALGELAP